MEKITEVNGKKVPAFYINPELNKYNDVVLFPEKLAKAKEAIENTNLLEFLEKIDKKEEVSK